MDDKGSIKRGNDHSARLFLGLLMLILSGLLTVVFCLQTAERWGGWVHRDTPNNPDTIIKTEVPPPETEEARKERQRQEALEKLSTLRQDAARELQELAARHEQESRAALMKVLAEEIAVAHRRVPAYVNWLVGWEATWEMSKAWWNDEIETFLVQAGEKNLLSAAVIHARLENEARTLAQVAAEKAVCVAVKYENRFTGLLASLDEQVRVQMPPFEFPSITKGDIGNPVIMGNMAGVSSFVGGSLMAIYGERSFVQWVGNKISIKAGSKIIRIGSGPVGWIISFGGGYLAEKGLDEYIIKPRLTEELHRQIDQVETALLKHSFIDEMASAQAASLREMASTLSLHPKT